MKNDCLTRMGLSFWGGLMKIFWNLIEVNDIVNVLNVTDLYTLNWLILLCEFHLNKKKGGDAERPTKKALGVR